MPIENLDFWYDAQQRRFLEQVVRAFSGFQYQTGMRNGMAAQLVTVPCRMASTDRLAANILRNGSDNSLNTVPMITVYQSGLTGRREDLQNLNLVESIQVVERAIDQNNNYTGERGNSYTVQRLMPVPFNMAIQVDIWTSNLDQKHQLAEQILTVIYPSFDIQNSDNPIDWTAMTTMYVEDITWSSRSVPVGAGDDLDIMTILLRLPIWLSPPAKVKQQTIITQIITNIATASQTAGLAGGVLAKELVTTPNDFCVRVSGNTIQLLSDKADEFLLGGALPSWQDCCDLYGQYLGGVTAIRVHTSGVLDGPYVAGTFQFGNQVNQILWTIDPTTLPANTLGPVNAVIDPLKTGPNAGLPAPVAGTRYLLVNDISPCQAWGNLTAQANDIIQYISGSWVVAQAAAALVGPQYLLNSTTGSQLRYDAVQGWVMAIDGQYGPGYWRLVFLDGFGG